MKLSKIAILAIKGAKGTVAKIADAVGVHRVTVYKWLNENHDNLTKAAILQVIREETGLSDSEILEQEKEEA